MLGKRFLEEIRLVRCKALGHLKRGFWGVGHVGVDEQLLVRTNVVADVSDESLVPILAFADTAFHSLEPCLDGTAEEVTVPGIIDAEVCGAGSVDFDCVSIGSEEFIKRHSRLLPHDVPEGYFDCGNRLVGDAGCPKIAPNPHAHLLCEPLETMLSLNQISDEELLEMRRLLDVFTCSLAARRRTTIDLDAIKEQLEKAKAPKVSIPEFAALDGSFHRALAAASHNRLAALMDQVYSQLVLVRLEDMFSHKSAEGKKAMIQNIISSHEKILMAVEAGDESAAKKAMEDHLLLFSKDL